MDKIDELLLDWYSHSQSYTPALGYGRADPACREFRTSRQWMDYDDLDAEVERNRQEAVAKTIGPMIEKLDLNARIAINVACRNMASGVHVWSSARIADLDAEYQRAKALLCPMLVSAGLIEKDACKQERYALA